MIIKDYGCAYHPKATDRRAKWHPQKPLAHSSITSDDDIMTMSQVQIIQSLGEALTWFEKELNWGVPQAELWHLSGRIGELYAAMITRGQMALR